MDTKLTFDRPIKEFQFSGYQIFRYFQFLFEFICICRQGLVFFQPRLHNLERERGKMLRLTIFRNEFKNLLNTLSRSSIRLRLFSDNWCPEEAASSSTSTRFVTLPTSKSFKATSSSQSGWSCIIRIRSSWSRRRRTPRLRDRSQSVGTSLPINFNVTLAQSFASNSP